MWMRCIDIENQTINAKKNIFQMCKCMFKFNILSYASCLYVCANLFCLILICCNHLKNILVFLNIWLSMKKGFFSDENKIKKNKKEEIVFILSVVMLHVFYLNSNFSLCGVFDILKT